MKILNRYRKFTLKFILSLLLILGNVSFAAPQFFGQIAHAATYDVCSSTCTYSTIQAAVTAASDGYTINVAAGNYTENVVVDKPLTIIGAGSSVVTLDATGGDGFDIVADNVNISGFKVTGGNVGFELIASSNSNLSNNIATQNIWAGFSLDPSLDPVSSTNNTFTNNTSSLNGWAGFMLYSSTGNTFDSNTSSSNGSSSDGAGFALDGGSANNTFTSNTVDSNYMGIYVNNGANDGNILNTNTITGSTYGISIDSSDTDTSSWTMFYNKFSGNTYAVMNSSITGTLDATNNWWGSAVPDFGSILSGTVSYSPWCADINCTILYPDTTPPVGGQLTITTILFPGGINIAGPNGSGEYVIPHALSIDGADVFTSLNVAVTDDDLNITNVPVYIDGSTSGNIYGRMVYNTTKHLWEYNQNGSLPLFGAGDHTMTATFLDNSGNTKILTFKFTTDATSPAGGSLTMTTNLFPLGMTVNPVADVYVMPRPLSIDGADVFTSLNVAVTDDNLNTANVVPVYIGGTQYGRMVYNTTSHLWQYDQNGSLPVFGAGVHNLVATFSDLAGNTKTLTIRFTTDNIAPTISFPLSEHDPILEATGLFTPFTFHPTVTDNIDPAPVFTSNTPIGSLFPLGVTVVTWTATDSAGNTATATQTVTIQDTISPKFDAFSNITAEAASSAGAAVTFAPTATDVTGTPSIVCDPVSGSTLALGASTVTCTATDSSDNESVMTFNVTVRDTTSPVLTMLGSSPVQVTVGATYTDAGATALDAVEGDLTSKIVPTSTVDISKVGSYTVVYTVKDSAGNNNASKTRVVNVVAAEVPEITSTTGGSTDTTDTTSTPADTSTTVASTDTGTPEVKGTSTTSDTDTKSDPGFFGSTWMGIYDWIWIIIAIGVIGGGAWWLFGARRQD